MLWVLRMAPVNECESVYVAPIWRPSMSYVVPIGNFPSGSGHLLHAIPGQIPHPSQGLAAARLGVAVSFRVEISPEFLGRFVLLDDDSIGLGPRVLTDPGHLPRHLDVRVIGADGESVVRDFLADYRATCTLPHFPRNGVDGRHVHSC